MSDTPDDVVLVMPAQDGQYHVRSSSGIEDMWPDTPDGLFIGEDNWVAVLCGTEFGPVGLTVRREAQVPNEIDTTWDMASEWSLDCPDSELRLAALYSPGTLTVVSVPQGWVRLRLSVRGRLEASAASGPLDAPIERHLLQVWSVEDREDPRIVHGPDEYAQYVS